MSRVRIPSPPPPEDPRSPCDEAQAARRPDIMASLTDLRRKWREDLAGWAIPEPITAAVTESPCAAPCSRADRLRRAPGGPSMISNGRARPAGKRCSMELGRCGLALLVSRTTGLTVVDTDDGMLGLLATRPARPVPRLLQGRWSTPTRRTRADLVTRHHVLYNVPDLVLFVHRGAHPVCAPKGGRRTHRQASGRFPQPVVAALPRPGAAGGAGRHRRPGHPGHDGPQSARMESSASCLLLSSTG